jgi:hypothetical protein
MDLNRIRRRLDDERRYLARDGESIEVLPHVTRMVIGQLRMVMWSGLNEANADEKIAAELAHLGKVNSAFEWKFYSHDQPSDLLSRLVRHGLVAGPTEAVMVFDLSDGPPTCAGGECVVKRITRPEQIRDYRLVAEEEPNLDRRIIDYICDRLADSLAQGSTQRTGYIAYCGSEPASIGRLFTHPLSAFGGLYGGTTRARFRGKGFYRALVAARAADAIEMGAKFLLVDALPTSRPILERLGFQKLCETVPCAGPG